MKTFWNIVNRPTLLTFHRTNGTKLAVPVAVPFLFAFVTGLGWYLASYIVGLIP